MKITIITLMLLLATGASAKKNKTFHKKWHYVETSRVTGKMNRFVQHRKESKVIVNWQKYLRIESKKETVNKFYKKYCKEKEAKCKNGVLYKSFEISGKNILLIHYLKKNKKSYFHNVLTIANYKKIKKKDIDSLVNFVKGKVSK